MAYKQPNNPFVKTQCGRRYAPLAVQIKAKFNSPFAKKDSSRKKPHTSWTQKDRDKYNRENPGKKVRPPQPEGGPRKDSYCARSAGIPKCKNPDKNGDCPNDIARRKWKC